MSESSNQTALNLLVVTSKRLRNCAVWAADESQPAEKRLQDAVEAFLYLREWVLDAHMLLTKDGES